jgi:hypothetical protein
MAPLTTNRRLAPKPTRRTALTVSRCAGGWLKRCGATDDAADGDVTVAIDQSVAGE